jgi:hypothetical protein
MSALFQRRCSIHAGREASARCLECEQFYCKECVTEHDDRLICSACLRQLTAKPERRSNALAGLLRMAQCVVGVFLCWAFFQMLGKLLLRMPSSFHEGTLWETAAEVATDE